MPSTNSAQPGTQSEGQQALRYLTTVEAHRAARRDVPVEFWPSQSQLLSRIDELVAAGHRKDASTAILLHELRSPLAAIQNAIAALRRCNPDESMQRRIHELIERQVHQVALLTASLCQASERGVENPQLHLERIDLRTVITEAVETVTPELAQRQQLLSSALPQSAIWVCADTSRLEQVFVNLLGNASKYSHIGGKVSISLYTCDAHAVVEVRDSGIGIAADALPSIFGLFVRADSKAVRTRAGQGIGLALVRSILDAHGGTVSASSAGLGQGSEFTVRLKLVT